MTTLETSRAQLLEAFAECDTNKARDITESFMSARGVESAVIDLVLPATERLGRLWQQGSFGVLHQRRVIQMVRDMTRAWLPLNCYPPTRTAAADRPLVMACPPSEKNDIPQRLFAVILQHRGIPTASLGAAVPWHAIADAVRSFDARGTIVFVRDVPMIAGCQPILRHLARVIPTYLFPTGESVVEARDVVTLPSNWWKAAQHVTEETLFPRNEHHRSLQQSPMTMPSLGPSLVVQGRTRA